MSFNLDIAKQRLGHIIAQHFALDFLEVYSSLELPPDFSLGDYALPTFKFAKKLGVNPAELAAKIAIQLNEIASENKSSLIESATTKGPFLNVKMRTGLVAEKLLPEIISDRYFKQIDEKEKVMVEFSQPNTHKEFHVGHARNVCLGDSICRLYQYAGFKVIPVNYIGDEGTHVAKCLLGVHLKEKENAKALETAHNKIQWLADCYVYANQLLKDENAGATENKALVSHILKEIEAKRGPYFEKWQVTREMCIEEYKHIYEWLDVHFAHYFYESEVSADSQKIVDEYLQKGLFVVDQGAVGIDMSQDKLGFFMVRKSDGSTLYITKDLALARRKIEQFKIDRSIYVVANEQNLHFKQLFHALKLMGFKEADSLYHLSYGMVVRPDGKMSSRAGNTVTFFQFKQLISNEINLILEKYKDTWTAEEIEQTSRKLTISAIKYGMLQIDPIKDVIFDPKEWVSFDGSSGPYLLYGYARTRSLLNKAKEEGILMSAQHLNRLDTDYERELMRYILDFNQAVKLSVEHHKPSTLAQHLFQMTKSFNRFYAETPILKDSMLSLELKSARLYLAFAFTKVLKEGLNLLGIETIDRM